MLRAFQRLFSPLSPTSETGDRAEQLAADWLRRRRGFTVLVQNWRNPRDRRDELDLVCRDHEVLVFVEVKARAAGAMVPGYYAVDQRKKRVLLRAAKAYLARLGTKPVAFRLDVVEISIPPGGLGARRNEAANAVAPAEPQILHFENVPLFPKYFRP
jgi:putative endonuclease